MSKNISIHENHSEHSYGPRKKPVAFHTNSNYKNINKREASRSCCVQTTELEYREKYYTFVCGIDAAIQEIIINNALYLETLRGKMKYVGIDNFLIYKEGIAILNDIEITILESQVKYMTPEEIITKTKSVIKSIDGLTFKSHYEGYTNPFISDFTITNAEKSQNQDSPNDSEELFNHQLSYIVDDNLLANARKFNLDFLAYALRGYTINSHECFTHMEGNCSYLDVVFTLKNNPDIDISNLNEHIETLAQMQLDSHNQSLVKPVLPIPFDEKENIEEQISRECEKKNITIINIINIK